MPPPEVVPHPTHDARRRPFIRRPVRCCGLHPPPVCRLPCRRVQCACEPRRPVLSRDGRHWGYAGLGDERGDVRGRIGLLNETLHALAASPLIDQRPHNSQGLRRARIFFRGAAGAYNLSHTRTAEGLAESLGGLIAGDAWKD